MPIDITLQPVLPDAVAEPLQLERGWATRIKFGKPPKDHVYLLRLDVVDNRGKALSVGSVLYMPDLKTGYNSSPAEANKEILRELAGLQMPKSAKLTGLLPDVPPPAAKK